MFAFSFLFVFLIKNHQRLRCITVECGYDARPTPWNVSRGVRSSRIECGDHAAVSSGRGGGNSGDGGSGGRNTSAPLSLAAAVSVSISAGGAPPWAAGATSSVSVAGAPPSFAGATASVSVSAGGAPPSPAAPAGGAAAFAGTLPHPQPTAPLLPLVYRFKTI